MKWLTSFELKAVLEVAKESRRDHLMILLTAQHALRRSELVSLKVSDLRNGMIVCKRAKGSNPVEQPLMKSENPLFDEPAVLAAYLAERNPGYTTDFLFPNGRGGSICGDHMNQIYKRYAKLAGLPDSKQHVHCLRHTALAHIYRQTSDILLTAQWGGHKNISNAQTYSKRSNEEMAALVLPSLAQAFAA